MFRLREPLSYDQSWYEHALTLLLAHDIPGYRQLTKRMAGDAPNSNLVEFVRTQTLGPDSAVDPSELVRPTEGVSRLPSYDPFWGPINIAFARYRAGQLDQDLFVGAGIEIDYLPQLMPFRAMAAFRLGRVAEARARMQKADQWFLALMRRGWNRGPISGSPFVGGNTSPTSSSGVPRLRPCSAPPQRSPTPCSTSTAAGSTSGSSGGQGRVRIPRGPGGLSRRPRGLAGPRPPGPGQARKAREWLQKSRVIIDDRFVCSDRAERFHQDSQEAQRDRSLLREAEARILSNPSSPPTRLCPEVRSPGPGRDHLKSGFGDRPLADWLRVDL